MWDMVVDAVVWEEGCAKPASSNVGDFEPLTLKDIGSKFSATGGPHWSDGHRQRGRADARVLDPVLRRGGRSREMRRTAP